MLYGVHFLSAVVGGSTARGTGTASRRVRGEGPDSVLGGITRTGGSVGVFDVFVLKPTLAGSIDPGLGADPGSGEGGHQPTGKEVGPWLATQRQR